MKRVFNLLAILGMFLVVSCGNSAQDQAQGNEDAENAANNLIQEAEESNHEEEMPTETLPQDSLSGDDADAPEAVEETDMTEDHSETEEQ